MNILVRLQRDDAYTLHCAALSPLKIIHSRSGSGSSFKGVDLTGLLGGQKEDLGSGDEVSRSWSFFCETTRNICIKIQQTKQQLLLLLDKINLAA